MSHTAAHIEAAIGRIHAAAPKTWVRLVDTTIPADPDELAALVQWSGTLLDGPNVRAIGLVNALIADVDARIDELLTAQRAKFEKVVEELEDQIKLLKPAEDAG